MFKKEFQSEEDRKRFLEKDKEIKRKSHHLDHWDQQGKFQAVTFHMADSIPRKVREDLEEISKQFLLSHPKPWDEIVKKKYRNLIPKRIELLLDNGYGSCVLKSPEIRKIVDDAILHYAEKEYYLHQYIVMPNHVHMLISMNEGYDIDKTLENLRHYTSRLINSRLNQKGPFWYGEPYKRLIRNEDHFKACISYIKSNPKFLPPDEFTLWPPDEPLK